MRWFTQEYSRDRIGSNGYSQILGKIAKHSTSETIHFHECPDKRMKIDYGLRRQNLEVTERGFTRCALVAMCQHLDAWYQEVKKDRILPYKGGSV